MEYERVYKVEIDRLEDLVQSQSLIIEKYESEMEAHTGIVNRMTLGKKVYLHTYIKHLKRQN